MDEQDERLNIEKTDIIDGLAYDKESFTLILLLADGMDWLDENRHLLLLQEKLNTYIAYIDTKQYAEKYPDVRKIEFQVGFLFKEPYLCRYLLERAEMILTDIFGDVEFKIEYGTMDSEYDESDE
ncbi:MAG: DUF6572 domain-containing protein [Acutalibacteraceae bacterium]|nr:DUF6572 domain-containing protein [Acutalibacteraceae bacterium]